MSEIRECSLEDIHVLKEISYETYYDTFEAFNSEENMNAYLESAYNMDKLYKELSDANSKFYFIYSDGCLAGYMKINKDEAQSDIHDPNALEIERLYIKKEFKGRGLGGNLMNLAIKTAEQMEKHYIWLGVWERNFAAQKFYKKFDFYKIGSHPFIMGDDRQIDYILIKEIV